MSTERRSSESAPDLGTGSPPQAGSEGWTSTLSGLLVPGGARQDETKTPASGLSLLGPRPTVFDQIRVFADETALGYEPVSRLPFLIEKVRALPFEASLLAAARLGSAFNGVRGDSAGSVRLATELLRGDPEFLSRMLWFLRSRADTDVTTEQHTTILLRLLIEHARNAAIDEQNLDEAGIESLVKLMIGIGTPMGELSERDTRANELMGDWLAYFVQIGAYSHRGSPLGEIARAAHVYTEIARRPDIGALKTFCSLDEWHQEDYGLSLDAQFDVGFALSAVAHSWEGDGEAHLHRYISDSTLNDVLSRLGMTAQKDAVLDVISGDRTWFADAFTELGTDLKQIVWETRPFSRRPFVKLGSGDLVLSGSQFLQSWLTDGFHYRSLDCARRRNAKGSTKQSHRYTSFNGALVEAYAVELAQASFGQRPVGGGRVWPEQPYGKKGASKTSDVAIDFGPDLVLIEVSSSRLAGDRGALGDTAEVTAQLDRLVLTKVRQLSLCIDALVAQTARIPAKDPEVDMSVVRRIWPVLLSASSIIHTEELWEYVDRLKGHHLTQARVQPLTVIDFEDFEQICGWVETGAFLPEILASHAEAEWRAMEMARWAKEHPRAPRDQTRPSAVLERWNTVTARVNQAFQESTS